MVSKIHKNTLLDKLISVVARAKGNPDNAYDILNEFDGNRMRVTLAEIQAGIDGDVLDSMHTMYPLVHDYYNMCNDAGVQYHVRDSDFVKDRLDIQIMMAEIERGLPLTTISAPLEQNF